MVSHNEYIAHLANGWKSSGVAEGDILLVHSDIKRTLVNARRQGVKLSPEDILESFLLALGPKGTLLLPLFNFDFPKTKTFDVRYTPSQMGALTEVARVREDVVRTGHPIYSFAVLGDLKEQFSEINNISGYGKDSPFGVLHKLDGKIASLDLEDQNSMTFYHYVEESLSVGYRYFKDFKGQYTNKDGVETERTYKLFVRDIENNVFTHVNPAGELIWERELYKGFRPKENLGLRTVQAKEMYDFVSYLITSGKAEGTLFKYGGAQ